MSRLMIHLAFGAALGLQSGCGGSPAAPLPDPAGASQTSPATGPSKAILEVSRFGVGPRASGGRIYYDGHFRLRETGGVSGAVIKSVTLLGGGNNAGTVTQDCWGREIRVQAGSIQDVFEWRQMTPSYCTPNFLQQSADLQFAVIVSFVDDSGVPGVASAAIADE